MKVRELIMMLVLNCDLDDKVDIEYLTSSGSFEHVEPKRVVHVDDEAVIECYD